MLYSVARTLPKHPTLNATFSGDTLRRYARVHLAFAVDTPKGLMVPVIRNADSLSLRDIALESGRLIKGCLEGGIRPDDLSGGTFTVTNLGALGIESFTPVLNAPQVAILGVCTIEAKPVMKGDAGDVSFIPHLGLSLTIDHQIVDGAPGARFLEELKTAIANIDVLVAG